MSPGYDIHLKILEPGYAGAPSELDFMITPDAIRQDITPASTRRSDGDTRFLVIQTESFWSQSDWAAGYGINYPADPASYYAGLVSTEIPKEMRAAQTALFQFGYPAGGVTYHLLTHNGALWAVIDAGGTLKLYELVGNTLTFRTNLATVPTSVVSYRQKIWIAYGQVANVQAWNPATSTLEATYTFKATLLHAYTSMLCYLTYPAGKTAWELHRYDPENPTTDPVLAIFSLDSTVPLAMTALGADLFMLFPGSLWRFTSTNGNSGTLTGPVDQWRNMMVGVGNASYRAALVVHKGGLYYSTGTSIRSYLPGGEARVLWPADPHNPGYGQATLDNISGLLSINDRLYAIGTAMYALANTGTVRLYCWNGSGMHQVGSYATAFSAVTTGYAMIAGDQNGLIYASSKSGVLTGGAGVGQFSSDARYQTTYYAQSTWTSSRLDFGMLDIPKSLSRVGISAMLTAAGQAIQVAVSVDGGGYQTLTALGSWTVGAGESLVYYALASGLPLVGKMFRFQVTLVTGGVTTTTPYLYAITAIPNPVNPIRQGFRFTVMLGELVETYLGVRPYDLNASVSIAAALDFLRACRAQAYPLELTWLDGSVFRVRLNTLTERRMATEMGQDPTWQVTCDAQELS